jgi:hypothetical protein
VFGLVSGLGGGLRVGLGVGLGVGLVFGLVFGLVEVWSSPIADSAEATPWSTHHQDAQTQLVSGLALSVRLV